MKATTIAKITVRYQRPNTSDRIPRTAGITMNGILSRAIFKILLPSITDLAKKGRVLSSTSPYLNTFKLGELSSDLVVQTLSLLVLQHHRIHLIFESEFLFL